MCGFIIRGLVLMVVLVKFIVVLAKGEKKSVKEFFELVFCMKELLILLFVGISINRKFFMFMKVFES